MHRVAHFLAMQIILSPIGAFTATAATRTWNAPTTGNVQNWFPGSSFSPSGLTDNDTIIFPNSAVHLRSSYNAGDYDFTRIEFRKAGYVVEKPSNFARISSRRWQLNQTSQSVSLQCALATLFGNAVIEVANAGAGFEIDGGIYFNSDATITIQGPGNVSATDLSDGQNAATIIKNGTGTFSILRNNSLRNGNILLNTGSIFCGGSVWSGNCNTEIASGGTLLGTGSVGSIVNRGIIRPGQTASSDTRGYRLTVNGTLTCPPGQTALVVFDGYNDESMDSLLLYGNSDFGGANLQINLSSGFKPAIGQTITLIQTAGNASWPRPFKSLPEGFRFFANGQPRVFYQISYRSGSNGASMTMTRIPTDLPNVAAVQNGNSIQLTFVGQPDTIHQVQFSTNLADWVNVAQVTLDTTGRGLLNRAITGKQGYYRSYPIEP